jgi:biotin carboxyl carrier protein
MDYEFLIGGTAHKISLEPREGKYVAVFRDKRLELDAFQLSPQAVSILTDGKSYLAHVARQGNKIFVAVGPNHFCLEIPAREGAAARPREGKPAAVETTVKAPMPGMVIKVNVSEGSEVNPGDGLVVVEAMKMEHEMRAIIRAIVEKVYVIPGQQVDAFQPLVELKPVETGM